MRDVGGLGVYLARAVAEGLVDGPVIYGAGAILSTTGGHADLHSVPLDWMHDYSARGGMMRLADGPDECARAVREQLRRNAKLIKVCASGGVLSELDDPIHQQFTLAELRAIVEVAGLAERAVAAHCHGKPGIMAALRAGVRTIEHGTYLDDECCDAMRETGAILVPTRTIIEDMLAFSAAVPPYAMAKLEAIADIHAQAVARAYEHGVTIAMGTDIALSGADLPNAWGQNGAEPGYLVKLGMSPLDAIEAATATGPLTLGPQAPRSGQLAEGYDADVITLDADPVADIGVLADPDRIIRVWTRGRQVKGAALRPAPAGRTRPDAPLGTPGSGIRRHSPASPVPRQTPGRAALDKARRAAPRRAGSGRFRRAGGCRSRRSSGSAASPAGSGRPRPAAARRAGTRGAGRTAARRRCRWWW